MDSVCDTHKAPMLVAYCRNCPLAALSCPHCLDSCPHPTPEVGETVPASPHRFITPFTLSDLETGCRKYRVRELVNNYFKTKKRELEADLEGYQTDVCTFIEGLPSEEVEQILTGFVQRARTGPIQESCGQMAQLYDQLREFRNRLNPEN